MYNLTLSVAKIGKYKTANNIVSTIEPVLEEFGISRGKLVSITTDNGSNVKVAITQLSTKISPSKPIYCQYFLYSTYIAIEEKKCKQLQEAQISTDKQKSKTINVIQNIETHWNSTYMALKRLVKLEKPIKRLINNLKNSANIDRQHDDLLYPFDKATEILSGSNYTTLCIIVPTIEELINCLNNTDSEFDVLLQRETIEELKDQFDKLNRQVNQETTTNTGSTQQATKKKLAIKSFFYQFNIIIILH
ncbi:19229_t:CDS:2 [Gigaspora margarita]|uniref:19229_t:CDS:1 n=1 Tax=Gigaspora margarita TaxID=4874 RepID=A0ABN7W5T4_GIGMA|nr:19229_t:CDS:2 [Gigaspora margarita]